jgi:hypothetical protein
MICSSERAAAPHLAAISAKMRCQPEHCWRGAGEAAASLLTTLQLPAATRKFIYGAMSSLLISVHGRQLGQRL